MVDRGFVSLGLALHHAALFAKVSVDAMPDNISLDDEIYLIETASAEANRIAEQILALQIKSRRADKTKGLAQAWLDGTYWRQVA